MRYHNSDLILIRILLRNLIVFIAGALIGCYLLHIWDLSGSLFPSFFQEMQDSDWQTVMNANARFLLILFFLSYLPFSALVVPIVFGFEGALLGGTLGLISGSMGLHGMVALILGILFRLILVFPFSFLLGSWAIRQSLRFGTVERGSGIKIFISIVFVAVISAALELTVGRQLGSLYYLSFGV